MVCIAGIIGQAVASPTDLVKVQMQADGKRVLAGYQPRYRYVGRDCCCATARLTRCNTSVSSDSGIGNAFATIARQGGVVGLWKGVIPNCQRAALVQLGDLTACAGSPT